MKNLEKFVTPSRSKLPATFKTIEERSATELRLKDSTLMYEPIVPVPTAVIKSTTSDDKVPPLNVLKTHPNGRYEDEAEDFYQQSPPPPRPPQKQIQPHTDTTCESVSESLSEGEVKCKCNASAGEIHLCKYARNVKGRVQYLKRNPAQLLRYELAEPDLEVVGQKKHYLNWVSYYVKRSEAF